MQRCKLTVSPGAATGCNAEWGAETTGGHCSRAGAQACHLIIRCEHSGLGHVLVWSMAHTLLNSEEESVKLDQHLWLDGDALRGDEALTVAAENVLSALT